MAELPTWGLSPKAQDDPTLIDEAIAAAIAAHESDPEAHLGDGESLQAHRQNEVIDHPAGSLVVDKTPISRYTEDQGSSFGEDIWDIYDGTGTKNWWVIYYSLFAQTLFGATRQMPWAYPNVTPEGQVLIAFQGNFSGSGISDGTQQIFFDDSNDPANNLRMTFEKSGAHLYFRLYEGGSVVHQYLLTTDNSYNHYISILFDPYTESITLSVDGNIVDAYVGSDFAQWILPVFSVVGSRSTNTSIGFQLINWRNSADIYPI